MLKLVTYWNIDTSFAIHNTKSLGEIIWKRDFLFIPRFTRCRQWN